MSPSVSPSLMQPWIWYRLVKRKHGGKDWKAKAQIDGGGRLPYFLTAKNIKAFINEDIDLLGNEPILYKVPKQGSIAHGIKADLIPNICDLWLKARDVGLLTKSQEKIAQKADILMRGLAHVGIIALIDEATGYQEIRARNALEQILEKFIAKELRKWAKTFPDEFYKEMFRLKDWQYIPFSVKRPGVVGTYTNDLIYERLAPGVLKELKRIIPKDSKGRRKHKYFQRLTEDVGHPRLREHLTAVIALMKASTKWPQFYRMIQRALPKYGETIPLAFPETDNEL